MDPITIDIRDLIKDDLKRLRQNCRITKCPGNCGARALEKVPPDPRRAGASDGIGPGTGHWTKAGERKRFQFQMDAVLSELFEIEQKSLGISGQRLLTQILYNRYGCPPLSFQRKRKIKEIYHGK